MSDDKTISAHEATELLDLYPGDEHVLLLTGLLHPVSLYPSPVLDRDEVVDLAARPFAEPLLGGYYRVALGPLMPRGEHDPRPMGWNGDLDPYHPRQMTAIRRSWNLSDVHHEEVEGRPLVAAVRSFVVGVYSIEGVTREDSRVAFDLGVPKQDWLDHFLGSGSRCREVRLGYGYLEVT